MFEFNKFADMRHAPCFYLGIAEACAVSGDGDYVLCSQLDVQCGGSQYRADFAIISRAFAPNDVFTNQKIIVEVDGHDFHERTKEQAKRDKKRDRAFACEGWEVIRFTGSEVWADPIACVLEVERRIFLHRVRCQIERNGFAKDHFAKIRGGS